MRFLGVSQIPNLTAWVHQRDPLVLIDRSSELSHELYHQTIELLVADDPDAVAADWVNRSEAGEAVVPVW